MRVLTVARTSHAPAAFGTTRRKGARGISRVALLSAVLLSVAAPAGPGRAAGIVVNDASDTFHSAPGGCALTGSGTCTLRDAITFSNANAGTDNISFAIGGTGTILVGAGGLPSITDAVAINGAFNVINRVTIDGSGAGGADGLTIASNGSSISNLVVQEFGGSGIRVTGSSNTIGGYCTTACPGGGVSVTGNGGHGIAIDGGSSNVAGNFHIEQNGGDGVRIGGGATSNSIGGLFGFLGGDIRGNAGAGVRIGDSAADAATTGNRVPITTLSGNGGLGIDLGGDGVTANDAQDPDAGPNTLQNYPVLTAASSTPCTILVAGSLNSTPSTTFTVELFGSAAADASGYGEGETRLASFAVTTDAQGDAAFAPELEVGGSLEPLAPGTYVTARATSDGGTSEFGPAVVVAGPTSPAPLGFHALTPCRVLDTRDAPGPWGGPALVERTRREFAIAGRCGVPADAQAVSVNVTVVDPVADGSVAVTAAGSTRGCATTISFPALRTRANNAIVRLSGGAVWAYPTTGTQLLLDVNGYFR